MIIGTVAVCSGKTCYYAFDEWCEEDHPRDDDGKFTSGSTSISSKELMKGKSEEKFRQDMLNELSNLNGKLVKNSSLGTNIEIRTSSIKKYKSFSADVKKTLYCASIN